MVAKGQKAPNAHVPTEATRRQVAGMAAANVSLDKIALAIGISINTLYKCYGQQIKEAKAQAEALVAQNLFNKATKGQGSDALKAAALWYAKAKEQERALPKKPIGRPSSFSQEVADKICEHIANGGYSTHLERFGLPNTTTLARWLNGHEAFRAQYARALEQRAEHFANELVEIADTETDPQRARVRVDARKWAASKLLPRVYGENQRVEITHAISIAGALEEAQARVIEGIAYDKRDNQLTHGD